MIDRRIFLKSAAVSSLHSAAPGAFHQFDTFAQTEKSGIYLRGEFGVRLEGDMHITENEAELFTPQSASLDDPFG